MVDGNWLSGINLTAKNATFLAKDANKTDFLYNDYHLSKKRNEHQH